MIFKNNWEKADQHFQVLAQTIQAMVALAFPDKKLTPMRCTPKESPNQCADICELIDHILLELGKIS